MPGNVEINEFTSGATAICGGPGAGGVSKFPLSDSSGSIIVGNLLVWKGLNGYAYFSVLLDCDSDGSSVSAELSLFLLLRGLPRTV